MKQETLSHQREEELSEISIDHSIRDKFPGERGAATVKGSDPGPDTRASARKIGLEVSFKTDNPGRISLGGV